MIAPATTVDLVTAAAGMRTVPPDVAAYETGAELARSTLRMPAAQLEALARAGFPCRRAPDGEPLFDYTDLTNVALRSGMGTTVPELARRFLLRFVFGAPSTWVDERTWRITVSPPRDVAQPRDATRSWSLRPIDGDAPGVTVHAITSHPTSAVVTIVGADDRVTDPELIALYEDILGALTSGRVSYQSVPETLRQQHERAWREGTADCVVVSRLLASRLAAIGRRARARRGYLLGLLGSDHAWAEVHDEGRWKCLDPVFELLASTAPNTADFQAACRGSRFNRLIPCATEDASPLVEIAGRPAPPWAMAGVSSTPAARPTVDQQAGGMDVQRSSS
jgi:hypothetical protein